jgi:hypothetical protein
MQPFDVIDAFGLGFFDGNVIKYVCRAGRKTDVLPDLEKAAHYLDEHIKRVRSVQDSACAPPRKVLGWVTWIKWKARRAS